jgi:hypothetical protein
MEIIYEIISNNPSYFAWAFGIVNVLWAIFLYFNKQSHERKLKSIQHNLNLDLERRKKVFELKVSQYESYVKNLDNFGRDYQSELFVRMQPIFQKYMERMLEAENDEQESTSAINQFSLEVMDLMNESMKQYNILKSESRSLKLTASDSLIDIFEELEALVEHSIEQSNQFISDLPMLMISGDEERMQARQSLLNEQGKNIQLKSKELERKMRLELLEI